MIARLGSGISLEKIPQNRLRTTSVIPRKKVLIPRHTEVYGRIYSEARNRRKWHEKNLFYKKSCSSKQNWQQVFIWEMLWNRIQSCCLLCGMVRNRIPSFLLFCSTERNSELFSLSRNGSQRNSEHLLLILFHGTKFQAFFSNGIPRIFCSAEQLEFHRNKPIVLSIPSSTE